MAISPRAAGAWAASNATTQVVTLPTHVAGDMLMVVAACKPYTADPTITNPVTGWNRLYTYADGSVANGNGTGSVRQVLFYREAASNAETNPTVSWGTTSAPGIAVGLSFGKDASDTWDTPAYVNGNTTNATAISVTMGSNPGITAGDVGLVIHTTRDNSALTVPAWTATGATVSATTEFPATAISSATSNDMAGDIGYRTVTAGTASAAPVCTGTQAAAETGVTSFVRLRVTGVDARSGTASATFTPTLSGQAGTKGGKGTGTLASTASLAAQGSKAAQGAGSATFTPSLAATGSKAWAAAAGTLALAASLAATGRKAARGAAGTLVTGPAVQAGTGRKGGQAAAGTLAVTATLDATGSRGVDARSGTGSMTITASLAASGRKGVARSAGTLAATVTLGTGTGTKAVARQAGTLALTPNLSWTARKGGQGSGAITLAASQAVAGRKGGRGQGSLAITPAFDLVGKHDGRAALGTWTLTPTLSAFGTSGESTARFGTGSMTLTPPTMSASGRKGGLGAGAITTSVSLAASSRKGGKGSGTLPLGAILATTARTARVGQALMPLEASLAAQATSSRYGVALQSPTITWAVTGRPGRAGDAGTLALVADMTATGLANARNLSGLEVAGSAQDAYAAGLASGDALAQLSGDTSASTRQDTYQARITEG